MFLYLPNNTFCTLPLTSLHKINHILFIFFVMAKKKRKKKLHSSLKNKPHQPDVSASDSTDTIQFRVILKYLPPLLIGITTILMAWWSWGKWSDPMIDFGRELYIPWQITEGSVLYKDIAYFNGPLSPYVNALWFFIMGVHMRSMVFANFIILGGILFVCYKLLKTIDGKIGATLGCLVLATVFAFARYDFVANYNFITPYSNEMTHGLLLSLVVLYCLSLYQRQKQQWIIFFSGVLLGLVFLTKAEFTLAAATALIIGYFLTFWIQEDPYSQIAQKISILIFGLLVPPLISLVLLSVSMPFHQAFMGTLGSWPGVFNSELRNSFFYKQMMGTNELWPNLKILGISFLCFALMFFPAGFISAVSPLRKKRDTMIGIVTIIGIIIISILMIHLLIKIGPNMLRPLPLLLICLIGVEGIYIWKYDKEKPDDKTILRFSFYLFSLMLLGKIILRVEPNQYGFALAMPGTLILVSTLADRIPSLLNTNERAGEIFRFFSMGIIIIFTGLHLFVSNFWFSKSDVHVATNHATFYTDIRGYPLLKTMEVLEKLMSPDDTLAVLPEGVMLNFLTQRKNPTPYINFMPPEFMLFGEHNMRESLKTHPPNFIVLTNKPLEEYGFTAFGVDIGEEIYAWIQDHYDPLQSIHYEAGPNFPFTEMNILRRTLP